MKMKLLVVDDQPIFKEAIRSAILSSAASEFVEVVSAKNAEEGIRLFNEDQEIAFLVADVHMPDGSGIDMVRQMKEFYPERFQGVEIFMVCADRDRIEFEACRELGVEHWLIKPICTEVFCRHLLERVPKYLRNLSKKMLLVVDDQALFRNTITEAILSSAAKEFVEVVSAKNAVEGIRLFNENLGITFMITDVHMPGGNGIDMLRQIKEQHPARFQTTEIFMACTEKDPTDYEACLELGIDRWLIKPVRTAAVCRYFVQKGREWSKQRVPSHVKSPHLPMPAV